MQLKAGQQAKQGLARGNRKAVTVRAQSVAVPPAWDRRVVVPEVQPRSDPKVRLVLIWMAIVRLPASCLHQALFRDITGLSHATFVHMAGLFDQLGPQLWNNPTLQAAASWVPAFTPTRNLIAYAMLTNNRLTCCLQLQRFSVLGSTGSIGTQTLDIMEEFPDQYKLVALAAGSNVHLLAEQVRTSLCIQHIHITLNIIYAHVNMHQAWQWLAATP